MIRLLTAVECERALSAALRLAGVHFYVVLSGYDDALDHLFLRVIGKDFEEVVVIPHKAETYPIAQFMAEVLAPFVAKLKNLPKAVDQGQKL